MPMISRSFRRFLQNSIVQTKRHPIDLYRPLFSWSRVSHCQHSNIIPQPAHQKPSVNLIKSSYLYMDSGPSAKPQIEEIKLKAHKVCDIYLGGAWSSVALNDLSVVPVSGGMSNFLYCCSLPGSITVPDSIPSKVLLRLYGSMMPECDIETQLEILNQLSLRELGPKIYGSFEGGRLEEFLPANSLTSDELVDSEISGIIAGKLAAIHDLDLGCLDNLDSQWLVNRLSEWSRLVMEKNCTSHQTSNRDKCSPIAHKLLAIDYRKEVDFLKSILRNTNSPQVFSHNDLHQGNILLATHSEQRSSLEERVIIIDFEYCSYNYRAFDIANHFSEWCFEYDIKEFPHYKFDKSRFPSADTQRRFARNYLEQVGHLNSSRPNNGCTTLNQQHAAQVSQTDVEALVNEVKPFLMASNLMWALWCIRSAPSSGIKFGYWEHAMDRWQLYSEFKLNYINETSTSKMNSNKKGCSESVVQNGGFYFKLPTNQGTSPGSPHPT